MIFKFNARYNLFLDKFAFGYSILIFFANFVRQMPIFESGISLCIILLDTKDTLPRTLLSYVIIYYKPIILL